MRRTPFLLALAGVVFSVMPAVAAGPPGGAIYAHDVLYRTVGTPTEFSSPPVDALYQLGGDLASVSESAPGDRNWNGGRWEVHPVTFLTIAPRQFTNAEDLLAAAARGEVSIGGVVKRFECPLIRAQ